jgi:hypothetical protein
VLRFVFLAALVLAPGAASTSPIIALEGNPPVFCVKGSAALSRVTNADLPAVFQVSVDRADVPPLAGAYAITKGVLTFRPQFPLVPGVTYRARFKLSSESATATFTVPKPERKSSTFVEQVFPTASTLPENQLKLYIHFSAPMSRGEAYRRIHLIDEQSGEVALPFVEIDEELWDRDYRRLTVLFDPGRIKRDLVPNREVGPPLKEGHRYKLAIDLEWLDAQGAPMRSGYTKQFSVGPPDRTPLDLKNWLLRAPSAGTVEALTIEFPEPIDAALLHRYIKVVNRAGEVVDGTIAVDRNESRWRLIPATPWTPGNHNLEIVSALEDLAGNKIGRAFDVDQFDEVQQRITTTILARPFLVKPASH